MSRILNWAYKEFREILPVWIFFFVSFALVAFIRSESIGEYHIKQTAPHEYLVASLIMAKVVLIVDSLKRPKSRRRPLIYSTLSDTGLYFVAAIVLHHMEQVIAVMRHRHVPFTEANREAFLMMEKPIFLALMAGVLALTFAFCIIRELIRAIGKERFMEIFFGRHPRRTPSGTEDFRRTA
jgi:hypothetical protein